MPTDDERREVARRLRGVPVLTLTGFDDDGNRKEWEMVPLRKLAGAIGSSYDGVNDTKGHLEVVSRLADLIEPQPITGDTSDGYHTFDELYDHRAKLFSVIVRCFKDRAWKSKLHHNGTMYEGMFIVGVETSQGQATYHYDIDLYWDIFDCKELVRAPEWDGHTPEQAISRITSLRPTCDRDALLALTEGLDCKADDIIRVAKHAQFSGLGPRMGEAKREAYEWRCIARCIRKALGVTS